jgi:hypothetical protein
MTINCNNGSANIDKNTKHVIVLTREESNNLAMKNVENKKPIAKKVYVAEYKRRKSINNPSELIDVREHEKTVYTGKNKMTCTKKNVSPIIQKIKKQLEKERKARQKLIDEIKESN